MNGRCSPLGTSIGTEVSIPPWVIPKSDALRSAGARRPVRRDVAIFDAEEVNGLASGTLALGAATGDQLEEGRAVVGAAKADPGLPKVNLGACMREKGRANKLTAVSVCGDLVDSNGGVGISDDLGIDAPSPSPVAGDHARCVAGDGRDPGVSPQLVLDGGVDNARGHGLHVVSYRDRIAPFHTWPHPVAVEPTMAGVRAGLLGPPAGPEGRSAVPAAPLLIPPPVTHDRHLRVEAWKRWYHDEPGHVPGNGGMRAAHVPSLRGAE